MSKVVSLTVADRPGAPPVLGDLLTGPASGRIVYRVLRVVILSEVGAARTRRYCLQCERVPAKLLPPGSALHPWSLVPLPRAPRAPAPGQAPPVTSPLLLSMGIRDRWMLERIQAKAPLLFAIGLAPVLRARPDAERAELARVARVGRDTGVVERADHGPPIRHGAVRSAEGALLRAADVTTEAEAADPARPNRTISRARRADPLAVLLKHRSISLREYDAGETLRGMVEEATPSLPGASQSEVHASPWSRVGVTDLQIESCEAVRGAVRAVAVPDRLVLTWILGGGTVGGYGAHARIGLQAVTNSLRAGLSALARHFYGAEPELKERA